MSEQYNVNGSQIYSALMSITKDAKSAKKDRGLDFRFLDKRDIKTDKEKADDIKRIEALENELDKHGITVEFYEDIDIKNTAEGCKFYFRIYDINNCYTEIDALEYRKVVIDPSESEVDYIAEKLFKIRGLKVQADVLEISNLVTELISYVYYFDELQYKIYENIGWDIYDKELIFKYDRIYKKYEEEIKSACSSDIAGKLTNDYSDIVKGNWRHKLAVLMNTSTVARIVISAACTGLVRSIMPYNKETNINMNIVGEPGSGKSSLSQFALSIFGDPHALEGSFIDKDNAMEIIRVKRPVIPYILDDRLLKLDTLSEKAKGRELMFDIFREYEGKVTERVGGAYKELSGKRTNAPIISSSVESMLKVLLESGKDLGQYRRFIELELKRNEIFEGNPLVVDEYHKLSYQNYGIGFQYIVNYILGIGLKVVNDLYDFVHADITEKLNKKSNETNIRGLGSSASRFALIATTYIIIREAINDNNIESGGIVNVGHVQPLSEDIIDKHNLAKFNDMWDDSLTLEAIKCKQDECYDQLVNYLIDNLVDKMKVVTFDVDIYRNLIEFLSSEDNKKWIMETNPNDFFANYKKTHIACKKQVGNKIEIYFLGKKNVEWLMCSGITLSDEQIQEYLLEVNQKNGKYKELAEVFWGSKITKINLEEKNNTYPLLNFRIEDRINSARNIGVLTVTLPKYKDNEEQAQ